MHIWETLNVYVPSPSDACANSLLSVLYQREAPGARWQDFPGPRRDTSDPLRTVERVLDIACVLYHLDQVGLANAALLPYDMLLVELLVKP